MRKEEAPGSIIAQSCRVAPELSSKVTKPDSKVQEDDATPSTACRLPEEVGAGRGPVPWLHWLVL